ncbi:hypothetical protein EYZ11_010552 [Aspergillus tanneri]|uniref:F-box domain-containing protein n=1 Tax=Aspergillus tanneri TaxID=1220188 RepID=A0A4S3J524_9EURO|nr:hypothetical protein EYZ11_010552 [Aspergillus tanneri]
MDRLPLEVLQLIAGYLDVVDLWCWLSTAKQYYLVLEDELYTKAVRSDEKRYGFPVYPIIAAIHCPAAAFKKLLEKLKESEIRDPDIDLSSVSIDFDWSRVYSNPYLSQQFRTSLLHILCAIGHVEPVQLALAKGADPSVYDTEGWTALHRAVGPRECDLEVVKLLLDTGMDPNVPRLDNRLYLQTPLHFAIKSSCSAVVERLINSGGDILAPLSSRSALPGSWMFNGDGSGVLSLAARYGDSRIVRCILSAGEFNVECLTAASLHAAENLDSSAMRTLLHAGAVVHRELLDSAARYNNLPVLRLLIDAGASVRELNDEGASLLWSVRSPEAAEMLLREAPDLATVTSVHGKTCLDFIFYLGGYGLGSRLPLVDVLINSGCEIKPSSEDVRRAIIAVAENLDIPTMEFLLKQNSSLVSVEDESRNSLLHLSAFCRDGQSSSKKLELIKMLVNFGCSINSTNGSGYSVLHCLFCNKQLQRRGYHRYDFDEGHISINWAVARLLIEEGVLEYTSTAELQESCHIATQHGLLDILQHLVLKDFNISHQDGLTGDTVLHEAVRQALHHHKHIEGFVRMAGCIILGYHGVSVAEVGGERRLHALRGDKAGRLEVIRLLCNNGVDASIRNSDGLTALDLVAQTGPLLPWDAIGNELRELGTNDTASKALVLDWAAGQEEPDLDGMADLFDDTL